MANKAFVKNLIDLLPFEAATLRQPLQSCSLRAGKLVQALSVNENLNTIKGAKQLKRRSTSSDASEAGVLDATA